MGAAPFIVNSTFD